MTGPRRRGPSAAPFPRAALLSWFDAGARALPWRATRDPYRVWVSEVMLQQTRVETVVRYYERFLARFPTVTALAAAPDEEVRAAWSGLGFYRRARSLHAAARVVAAEHGGVVPTDPAAFGDLPGVGRYTLGAVLSISHDAPLPVLDGNVARVLCRLRRVPGDPTAGPTMRQLWALADELLPPARTGAWNQALMELGATVCKPTSPRCGSCPVAGACEARAEGLTDRFPEPRRRAKVQEVVRAAVYLERADGRFLLAQRPPEGLLASLWELPALDVGPGSTPEAAAAALARSLGAREAPIARGQVEHVFTHRRWTIHVVAARAGRARRAPAGHRWVTRTELDTLGVPTVTRRTLEAANPA